MFLGLNSKGLYQTFRKRTRSCGLVFTSWTKREFRHFHVVVVQRLWRQRNVQKKSVMHGQSCCFANLNLLLFCRSRCHPPSSFLKLPNRPKTTIVQCKQGAKKVVYDSPELVDFVLNLPNGQVNFLEEFKLQENCEINSAHQLKSVLGASWNDVWASIC